MRYLGPLIDGDGSTESKETTTSKSKKSTKVEVERGDTLSSIARENNTTVKAILAANPKFTEDPKYKGGNTIFAGTKVVIPSKVSTPPKVTSAPTPAPVPAPKVAPKLEPASVPLPYVPDKKPESIQPPTIVPKIAPKVETNTNITSSPLSFYVSQSVNPTPLTPSAISATIVSPPPPPVKTATPDIILFDDESTPIDTMADLIFENIGGIELINITRSDIVNGQKISYQPIKNLSSIQQRYNPNNILGLQQTADKYFSGFSIKLEDKIPNEGNGPNGENVYINDLGDLVIEFININNDEQVEIQIAASGTIYDIDLGDNIS